MEGLNQLRISCPKLTVAEESLLVLIGDVLEWVRIVVFLEEPLVLVVSSRGFGLDADICLLNKVLIHLRGVVLLTIYYSML